MHFESALVRIYGSNGDVVGTGFVVDDNHIITCAHVIYAALGRSSQEQYIPTKNDLITFDAPFRDGGRDDFFFAYPLSQAWAPPHDTPSFDMLEDFAALRLSPRGRNTHNVSLPRNISRLPIKIISLQDSDAFNSGSAWIRGYTGGSNLRINVTKLGLNHFGRLQLNHENFHVEPGMSGAPVWAPDISSVIGILVVRETLQDKYIAWATPMAKLAQVWLPPGFHEEETSLGGGGSVLTSENTLNLHTRPHTKGSQQNSKNIYRYNNSEVDFNKPFSILHERIERKLDSTELIKSIAIHPDGECMAFSQDEHIFLLDLNNPFSDIYGGELVDQKASDSTHLNNVTDLSFSPDGLLLASSDSAGMFRIWRHTDAAVVRECHYHSDAISGIRFSRDGQRLAVASYDELLTIWNIKSLFSGENTPEREFSKDSQIKSVPKYGQDIERYSALSFSHDGRFVATGDSHGNLKIHGIASQMVVKRNRIHNAIITCVEFSPVDPFLIATSSADKRIRLSNFRSGDVKAITLGTGEDMHTDCVNSLAFSYRGDILISSSSDGEMKIWDIESKRLIKTFKHIEQKTVEKVAFFPKRYDFASDSIKSDVSIWNIINDGSIKKTTINTKLNKFSNQK